MKSLFLILILTAKLSAQINYQAPTIPAEEGKLYNEIVELRSKDPQNALKRFLELPEKYSPAFDYLQAVILIDLKLEKRSAIFLKKALVKLPSFYQARLTLAQVFLSMKDYKSALPEFMEVVKLGRADGAIWKYISMCNLELKRYDAAELSLNQARLFDADDKTLDHALLNIFLVQEDYLKSEKLASQLLNKNPDDKDIWSIYIQSLLANDKQKEALLNQDLKVRLFGKSNEDLKLLADLYYNSEVFLKAAEVYLKIEGELSGRATVQAARCYALTGSYQKVINILRDPDKLSPGLKEKFYTIRGEAELKLGNKKSALSDFKAALKFNSDNSYALFYAAEILEGLDQLKEALDYYSRASKNSSYFVSSKLRRAGIYLNLNKNALAMAEVEDVRKVDNSPSTEDFYKYLKATLK